MPITQRSRISIYPKLKSDHDPFLANLVSSLEARGATCHSWTRSTLTPLARVTHVLNWPENLWCRQPNFWKRMRNSVLRQVLGAFLWLQNTRGNPVIMIIHNAKPHHCECEDPWFQCSQLTMRIDVFLHFSRTSVELLRPKLDERSRHEIVKFPMSPSKRYDSPKLESSSPPQLVLLGVREKRKNLHEFLHGLGNEGSIPIVASGFNTSEEFVEWCGLPGSRAKNLRHVQWLGARATEEELDTLLRSPNKLLLNQTDQLNSGLLWLAVSQGAGVIAPRTASFEEIRDSMPKNSLQLFTPPLTAEDLKEMMVPHPPELTEEIRESHSYDTLATRLLALSLSLRQERASKLGA